MTLRFPHDNLVLEVDKSEFDGRIYALSSGTMKYYTVPLLCQKKDNGLYIWRKRRVGGNMKLVISNNKQRDTTESEIMRLLYTGIAGAARTMIVDCQL